MEDTQILALDKTQKDDREAVLSTIQSYEAAACLRTLVFIARSSGPLTPGERVVLEEEWSKLTLPPGMTLAGVLDEKIDLNRQLQLIVSEEARERTYNAAYLLAHMDGKCTAEQQHLLDEVRIGLRIPEIKATPMGRMYWEARELIFPGAGGFIHDPVKRAAAIKEDILKFSLINAVSGAFPIPILSIAADLIVVSTQTIMVRDIGRYWGHTVDKPAARSLMASVLGATGMRIAIHSLLNTIPVLGSTVGAATSFATTWALGNVANTYFESGGKLEAEALRKLYEQGLAEASSAYEKSKEVVEARIRSRKITLELLNEDLKAGKISTDEYHRKVAGLH